MPWSRVVVASLIAFSLSGCSFLGGSESDDSASAPLTETSTASSTATASDTATATDSSTSSDTASASGSETATESTSSTSTLADPNETSSSADSTLANPTASGSETAGSLPLTVRGDSAVTRSVGLPSSTGELAFRATCGTESQIVVKLTYSGSSGAKTQSLRAGPCTASQPLLVQREVPKGSTKVSVAANTDPAGEFWLVVTAGQ